MPYHKMKLYKKPIVIVPVFMLALIIVAAIALATSNDLQRFILNKATDKSGRKIETAENIDIKWRWPVTTLEARNLTLSNPEGSNEPNMFSVDHAKVSIDLWHAVRGNVFLPEVVLEKPFLLLEKDAEGRSNWSFKNPDEALASEMVQPDERGDIPGIGKLVITDGKVKYRDAKTKTDFDLAVDTVTGQAGEKQELQFKGTGALEGKEFKLDVTGGNIFELKETDDPYPVSIHVAVGGTKADLVGTVKDPIKLEGMDTTLTLAGPSAAELFTLFGIVLPPTPPYKVKGRLDYKKDVYSFENFKGKMGSSDLGGSVTWDKSDKRPILRGEFVSNNLDFKDLGGLVGAAPAKTSAANAPAKLSSKQKQDIAEQQASPYVIPDTPLDISRLKAMDADVTFTGKKLVSQSLPLDDFFMKVNLDNSLLKIDPVRFGTARGDIKVVLTINARQEPVRIAGDFYFRKLALKPIFEKLAEKFGTKNVTDGYIGGAAHLKGTGKSLRQMLGTSDGDIGVGMEGGQISNLVMELAGLDVAQGLGLFLEGDRPVPVRCMIGDFAVKDGTMQVRHFVLDTTDTKVVGQGNINLKNEKMNLTMYAMPKDNSPFTLNSPISVKGTMKKPEIDPHLGRVAGRGIIAAALAAVFPPAAVVAFIEPGLGEDSNCVKLVSDTKQNLGVGKKSDVIPKNKTPKAPAAAPRDPKKAGG